MNKVYSLLASALVVLISSVSLTAQVPQVFQDHLVDFHEVSLDVNALKLQVEDAPMKGLTQVNKLSSTIINMPLPDGTTQQFRVVEAPILSPVLSSQRPDFKSYIAQGIDDPTATARFNITPAGFYAMISGIDGISYVELADKTAINNSYIAYYDHHIISENANGSSCGHDHSEEIGAAESSMMMTNSCFQYGDNLRNYDIVLTCSGEFYQLNGNTDALVEAALLNRMTQVNGVYEPELAVSFTIVEYLLNDDPTTDPYANPSINDVTNLNATENYINNNVTVGSWDIGHGFHEITCGNGCGWGGIAGLGVVCTSSKGRGYTYLPNDIPNNITVLLHEFGHQFSCRHTNYGCGSNNNCGRYEPGQGTSIMSTSAFCTNDDDYANRSDYFGIGSLVAAQDFITTGSRLNNNVSCSSSVVGGWSYCATNTATGNNMPTSDANADNIDGLTIPHSTPFTLSGSGSDPDGAGSLTYNWEQFDTDFSGSVLPDNAGTSTVAPLFRSFPPSTSDERTCPQLSSILAGNVTAGTGEVLPTVARTMTWRLTVRDNEMGGGGVACDEISITVGSDGPFQVTSQNASPAWSSGNTETVTWDVANTDDPSYSCPNVDVLYSSDGGNTFNVTLASNVPNDGSQDITVPATATTTGRIKIVCSGSSNIFFDINDTDIAIISGCPAEGGTIANSDAVSAPAGDASLNLSLCAGTPITEFVGVLDNGDPSSNLAVENNGSGTCTTVGNSPNYELVEFAVSSNASINFTTSFGSFFNMMTLYENSYDPSNECDNWLNSNGDFVGGSVNLFTSISETLTPGVKYVLLSSGFNSGAPSPGDFDIDISTTVYDISGTTPTGFLYTYVIVDNTTGNIVAIDADSDLSDDNTFPEGDYSVHGLSYQNGTNLAGYVGGAFATLQNDLVIGTICGDLSTNNVSVTILGPLPIELIDFFGRLADDKVVLNWQTLSETNNDYFIVEKSLDGRSFSRIGIVEGNGTTLENQNYELVDPNPVLGTNYYRLTQVDYDGTFKVVEQIIAVEYDMFREISIQPNPVKGDQVQLIYPSTVNETLKVELYNINGMLIQSFDFETSNNTNIYDINLSNLSNGVYILKTSQLNNTQSLRLVKTSF